MDTNEFYEDFAENASFKHMDSRKISEDERFFDIVMHSKNPTSRMEALDRINDDVLLSYISLLQPIQKFVKRQHNL